MSEWPLALVIVSSLATGLIGLIICSHSAICHDTMPYIAGMVGSALTGSFALATQVVKTGRKSKHPTGPHRTVGDNDR